MVRNRDEISPERAASDDESKNERGEDEGQRSQLHRLRRWVFRARAHGLSRRTLPQALAELDTLSLSLHLTEDERNLASNLLKKACSLGFFVGRSARSIVAATVYAAARILGSPRQLGNVAELAGLTRKDLAASYRNVVTRLRLKIPVLDPCGLAKRMATRIDLPDETLALAIDILKKAKDLQLFAGRDPWGIAGAAIYLASLERGPRISQKTVARVAGVTEVTIRVRYQELRDAVE